jgi:hypothetical protein
MYEWTERTHDSRPVRKPLAETLRQETEWLENDLWQLFELEDAALSSRDSWQPHAGAQTWQQALCELAAEGTIPRKRLLDESLRALRRDFSAHNARWYYKLYEALEPTEEEQLERLDQLLALLAAPDPATVGFALRALGKLERTRSLPVDRVLEAVPPALLLAVKTHASRAVKLVGRLLERHPNHATIALPILIQALAHESRDVQELVLDLLERHRDALSEDDRAGLGSLAPEVDPALRSRAERLGGRAGVQRREARQLPSRGNHPMLVPREPRSRRRTRSTSCSTGWRLRWNARTIPTSSSSCSTASAGCGTSPSPKDAPARFSSVVSRSRRSGDHTSASTTRGIRSVSSHSDGSAAVSTARSSSRGPAGAHAKRWRCGYASSRTSCRAGGPTSF